MTPADVPPRRTTSAPYGPEVLTRSRSESSGTRTPPDLEPSESEVLRADVRALRAHVAEAEGRILANLSVAVASIKTLANGTSSREVEEVRESKAAAEAAARAKLDAAAETQFGLATRIEKLSKHRGWAIIGVVALAIIEAATQILRGGVTKAAEVVATDAAQEAAAEIVEAEVATKVEAHAVMSTNTLRLGVLETRFTTIESKLDDLLERLPVHPPEPKRKAKSP